MRLVHRLAWQNVVARRRVRRLRRRLPPLQPLPLQPPLPLRRQTSQ